MLKEELIYHVKMLLEAKKKKGEANTWGLGKGEAGKLHEVLVGGFINHYAKTYQANKSKGDKHAHAAGIKAINNVDGNHAHFAHMEPFEYDHEGAKKTQKKNAKDEHNRLHKNIKGNKSENYDSHVQHAKRAAKELISHMRSKEVGIKDIKKVHWTADPKDVSKLTGGKDDSERGNNSDIVIEHGHKKYKAHGTHFNSKYFGVSVKAGENIKLHNPGIGKIARIVDHYHKSITDKDGKFAQEAAKAERNAQKEHHKIVASHASKLKRMKTHDGGPVLAKGKDGRHILTKEGIRHLRKTGHAVYSQLVANRLEKAKKPTSKSLQDHIGRMMSVKGKHQEKKEFMDKLTNLHRVPGKGFEPMAISNIGTKNEKAVIKYVKPEYEQQHKEARGEYKVSGSGISTNVHFGNEAGVNVVVDSSPAHGDSPVTRQGLHVWHKPRKNKKKINEEAPVNVIGGGINGLGTAIGGIQGTDPILFKNKVRTTLLKRKIKQALGEARVTTKPNGNGYHTVFIDGEEHPHVHIVNGSGGVSGYGRNVYGIHYSKPNKTRWIGSLAKTKAHLNKMLDDGAM